MIVLALRIRPLSEADSRFAVYIALDNTQRPSLYMFLFIFQIVMIRIKLGNVFTCHLQCRINREGEFQTG